MASGQIKRSDIAESDLYKEIRDSAKKTLTELDKMNVGLKKTATTISKTLNSSLKKSTEGINKMSKAVAQADATMKQSVQVDKAKSQAVKAQIQAERELERLQQDKIRTSKMESQEKERLLKQSQRQKKLLDQETNAYKKLVKATRDQKNESKRLGAELLKLEQAGKKNTKEYRKLQMQFDKVTRSARSGDKQLKKLDKTVGDNFRNVGNYRGALGKLSGAFASLGLAMGGAMIIRNVFETVKEFDQASANLASVLGVTREGMRGLTDDAMKYGSTTRFTATEVSNLQTEFAKLGFSQSEISNVTKATLDLASATGTDLAESATVVGATVRAFGLSTEQTARVTDVMSKSFSSSSLDMQKFSTAMGNVAPVAKSAGLNIEETTALLGTLTDNGIDASTAGTGLRNVFLELTKSGMTFDEAMGLIQNSTNKNATALELFGKRGATIGTVLASNTYNVETLTNALYDSAGATQIMADMQLNTLGGSLDLLTSAWDGYILKANEAGGVGDILKVGIKFLADNLETILDVVVGLTKAWIQYKIVVGLSAGATRLMGSTMAMAGTQSGMMAKGLFVARAGVNGLKTAFASLGKALMANAFGLIILALYKLYEAFTIVNTAGDQLEKINERLQQTSTDTAVKMAQESDQLDVLVTAIKGANKVNGERDTLIADLNKKYGTTLTNIQDETKFLKELDKVQKDILKNIEDKIMLEEKRTQFGVIAGEIAKLEAEQLGLQARIENAWGQNAFTEFLQGFGNYEGTKGVLARQAIENDKVLKALNAQKGVIKTSLVAMMQANAVTSTTTTTTTTTPTPTKTKRSPINVDLRDQLDLYKEILKVRESIRAMNAGLQDSAREREIAELDKLIEKELEIIDLRIERGQTVDLTDVNALIGLSGQKQKDDVQADADEEIRVLTNKHNERFVLLNNALNKEFKKKNENNKLTKKERAKLDANLKEMQADLVTEEIANRKVLNKQIAVVEQESADKIVEINTSVNEKLNEVDELRLVAYDAIQERRVKSFENSLLESKKSDEDIAKEMKDFNIKILEERILQYKKYGKDTLDLEIELNKLKRKNVDDENKAVLTSQKDLLADQISIIQSLTDAFNFFADKRISKIDEEINKAQERYNTYQELAKNGNIQAQQSLATEAKLIAESNRKKEQMEKRKQRIALASDALQAYLRNSEDPDVENPLLKTFTDITLLTQFVQNLPFFEDGIEDTGKNGSGVDGRGGFHAILHPNERVLTKKQNAMVGNISNEDLAKLALRHQTGVIDPAIHQTIIAKSDERVVERLESLEKTIKNKPVSNIELERIIDGAMQVVKTTTNGKKIIYNRYKIN
tara:strand:+ start:15182 stop:19168 length:3987 start_codon:yes stop_codon:yes gene_type:complete